MPSREKTVVLSIAAAVGAWIVWSVFSSMFLQPIAALDIRIEGLEATKKLKENQDRETLLARRALNGAQRISLPRDRNEAQRLYLKWLTDITTGCGFTEFDARISAPRSEGEFWTIPITFTAKASYEQTTLFLRRFSEVDLLHRLSSFQVAASDPPGNPRLKVSVTAEGLAMPDAPPRTTLLPLTSLSAELTKEAGEFDVGSIEGFPTKAPFRIRIGSEWLNVAAVNQKDWTVERGIDGSVAAVHSKGESIELWPLRPTGNAQPAAAEEYAKLAAANIFAKPRPKIEYRPRLSPYGTQPVVRGTALGITVKAESWDPAYGTPMFEFEGDIPEGLSINPRSGEMKWNPPDSVEPGEYKVKVVAVAEAVDKRIPTELTLKLRNANRPPAFSPVENPVAYLGRPLVLDSAAKDPDPNDRLTYSLTGQALAGATLDPRSGRLTWTPPEDLDPGVVRIEITATDNGEPPMSAKRTLSITTAEDAARFTRLTTIFGVNGERQARFYDPSIGKTTAKRLNESFKFADVEGKVVAIDSDRIVFETAGQRMQLELGMAVRDMKPAPAAAKVEEVQPTADDPPPPPPVSTQLEGETATPAPMTTSKSLQES